MAAVCSKTSQQCHKYFLQCSTFASKRPQLRTWGRHTCFLPRAPSNLVTPCMQHVGVKNKLVAGARGRFATHGFEMKKLIFVLIIIEDLRKSMVMTNYTTRIPALNVIIFDGSCFLNGKTL